MHHNTAMLLSCLPLLLALLRPLAAAPTTAAADHRRQKSLYYDYLPQAADGRDAQDLDYAGYATGDESLEDDVAVGDGVVVADEDEDYAASFNDLSQTYGRTAPSSAGATRRRRPSGGLGGPGGAGGAFNSPVYYIRLPPQPYVFVPGVGYVSPQAHHAHAMTQFLNVPVSFVANGKPSAIYQWGGGGGGLGGLDGFQQQPQPPQVVKPKPAAKPKPPKPAESNVHRLQGQFAFNGKPNDIFVLRDSYNSLYSDALQNFYP